MPLVMRSRERRAEPVEDSESDPLPHPIVAKILENLPAGSKKRRRATAYRWPQLQTRKQTRIGDEDGSNNDEGEDELDGAPEPKKLKQAPIGLSSDDEIFSDDDYDADDDEYIEHSLRRRKPVLQKRSTARTEMNRSQSPDALGLAPDMDLVRRILGDLVTVPVVQEAFYSDRNLLYDARKLKALKEAFSPALAHDFPAYKTEVEKLFAQHGIYTDGVFYALSEDEEDEEVTTTVEQAAGDELEQLEARKQDLERHIAALEGEFEERRSKEEAKVKEQMDNFEKTRVSTRDQINSLHNTTVQSRESVERNQRTSNPSTSAQLRPGAYPLPSHSPRPTIEQLQSLHSPDRHQRRLDDRQSLQSASHPRVSELRGSSIQALGQGSATSQHANITPMQPVSLSGTQNSNQQQLAQPQASLELQSTTGPAQPFPGPSNWGAFVDE